MHTRYALYFTLPETPLSKFGAAWLGWDVGTGTAGAHPEMPGVDVARITERPRKYGMHATLKPPFRLAEGQSLGALEAALAAFTAKTPSVRLDGLALTRLGGFLALTPEGDVAALNALAGRLVTEFDSFRAPAPEAELARRRAAGLTAAQEANLVQWGYPYVLDEFRFHITLSTRLEEEDGAMVSEALAPRLAPLLPRPFEIDAISIAGEREDGFFELLGRMPLKGV